MKDLSEMKVFLFPASFAAGAGTDTMSSQRLYGYWQAPNFILYCLFQRCKAGEPTTYFCSVSGNYNAKAT